MNHTDWVVGTIQSIPALATKTFTAIAPRDTKAPYAVVWPAENPREVGRITGPSAVLRPRFTLHVVGTSVKNAQTITAAIESKFIQPDLHGVIPAIPGELCGRVWWQPVDFQVDNDIVPPLVYGIVELGFTAEPVATP